MGEIFWRLYWCLDVLRSFIKNQKKCQTSRAFYKPHILFLILKPVLKMAAVTGAAPNVDALTSQYIEHEKLVNEEFKIWKKTVPFLYDTIQTYAQETCSLTVEPLPNFEVSSDGNEIEAKFFIGTYDNKADAKNYLKLASVKLPSTLSPNVKSSIPIQTGPSQFPKFSIKQQWKHPGEVNKVRYNKFNNKIATFAKNGDIRLWDFNNEESLSTLKFHKKDGFGLEWGLNNDRLLTGGEDFKIALWDISKYTAHPLRVFETHNSIINDFSWNHQIPALFGSVSDDRSVQLIDTRSDANDPLIKIADAHKDVINAIEFHPTLSAFVTGSADNLINLWDLRYTEAPLRQLYGHSNAITQLKFNPTSPNLLGSSSNDRRIHIWDLDKLDEEFEPEDLIKNDAEDPTLAFVHGGHTAKITEFNWIPGTINTIVSAAEDGLVEVWKPHLPVEEEEEEEEEENIEAEDANHLEKEGREKEDDKEEKKDE